MTHPVTVDRAPAATAAGSAFARLCTAGFLAYCSYAICRTPLLPLLARELGASAPQVGFVVGASTLTGVLLKLPAGAWSDVLGRRPLLLLGSLVFALMPFAYIGIASLAMLVALRFAHGSATAIFGPVASASLSDLAPPDRRGAWLGTYAMLQGAGQALGPVIAGYLVASGRYDRAFVTAGLIALAAPIVAASWPVPSSARAGTRRLAAFTQAILDVGRRPLVLVTSLAQAGQLAMNGALNAFLPLFALEVHGLGASQVGWLFAAQTMTTLAVKPLVGMLSDRVGRRSVIVAGLGICSGAVYLLAAAAGVPGLVAAVLVYAAGVAITSAATTAYITDLSGRARYGAAHGLFGTIYDVGDALGPIAAGFLVAGVGYAHMFQILAGIALAAAVVFHAATRSAAGAMRSR